MKTLTSLFFLFFLSINYAQLTAIEWTGDTSKFDTRTDTLKLKDLENTGFASIYTNSKASVNAKWEITSRLEFAPSSSNGIDYILTADSRNSKNYHGYFLHIGETGSNDALELYRKDGESSVLLKRGIESRFSNELDSFKLIVTRDQDFNWNIETARSNETELIQEIVIVDSTYLTSNYFGLALNFTSTRSDKFSFWNIQTSGESLTDTTAPFVVTARPISDSSILINLSEEVLINSEINATINGSIFRHISKPTKQQLLFTFTPFLEGENLVFNLGLVSDLNGNKLELFELLFTYHETKKYDVLITEVYPDPEENSTLPNAEYIEIYNNSGLDLDLNKWLLKDFTSEIVLPQITLRPVEVLVLAEKKDSSLFSEISNILLIDKLPTLNNTNDRVSLHDSTGKEIHSLYYSSRHVTSGESIELSNTGKPCLTNYLLNTGGSPGTLTTTNREKVNYAIDIKPYKDSIVVSSAIDSLFLDELEVIIDNEIASNFLLNAQNDLSIHLPTSLLFNEPYFLEIKNFSYCDKTKIDTTLRFILTDKPEENEVIFTEVLFNPDNGISEFIEIYNATEDEFFTMNDLYLEYVNVTTGEIRSRIKIENNTVLEPQTYYVICKDKRSILDHYLTMPDRVIEVSLPTLNNDRGTLRLSNKDTTQIDCVSYDEEWHSNIFSKSEKKGKSLERIDLNDSGKNMDNWFSSSFQNNYASPTFQNSVFDNTTSTTDKINLNRANVSPDGDGFEDFVFLLYKDLPDGTLMNVTLFNSLGKKERTLLFNRIVNKEGKAKLDFSREGFNPEIGIHVLLIELTYADGKSEQFKLALTVNKKF